MLGWVVYLCVFFLLLFIKQLHAVRSGSVFSFFGCECVHRLRGWKIFRSHSLGHLHRVCRRQFLCCCGRHCSLHLRRLWSRHVLGSDWSLNGLNLLHAMRSRQVLYVVRGNVGLNMRQLPRLCKLAVWQRLDG
jgi:hypothetical protein